MEGIVVAVRYRVAGSLSVEHFLFRKFQPAAAQWPRLMLKYLHILSALLFITIGLLQLNDPDPIYWVAAYSLVVCVSGANYLGKRSPMLFNITVGMVLAGLLTAAPGALDYLLREDYASIYGQMSTDRPYIESAREFGGLAMAAIYLLVAGVWLSAGKNTKQS